MTLADFLKPDIYNRGIEHGIQQGLEQGKVEGKVEGKIESKMDIAQNMLAKGADIDFIASVTGLSNQEIKGLAH